MMRSTQSTLVAVVFALASLPSCTSTRAVPQVDQGVLADAGEAQVDVGPPDSAPPDAGPFNALGRCATDNDCAPDYQCGVTLTGVQLCVPVGPLGREERCGDYRFSRSSQCAAGLFCDWLTPEHNTILNVCRSGCQTHADCLSNEGCVTEYFPGDAGLCVRADCDYDGGLAQGDVSFNTELFDECACLPWELGGADFEHRDKCVYALHVGIGEACFDDRAWCNARGETPERSGVAGVCLRQDGEPESTCRQLCRSGADCGVGTSCVDVTDTLGAELVQDLVDQTDYDRRFSTIRLCVPD